MAKEVKKTNWEDVIKASVKGNPKPKSHNMNMNDSYHVNELTNAVVKRFPSLHNNISITFIG